MTGNGNIYLGFLRIVLNDNKRFRFFLSVLLEYDNRFRIIL